MNNLIKIGASFSVAALAGTGLYATSQSPDPIIAFSAWSQFVDDPSSNDPVIVGRVILEGDQNCANLTFKETILGSTLTGVERKNPGASDFPVTVCQAKFPSDWNEVEVLDPGNQRVKVKLTNENPAQGPTSGDFTLQGPAFVGQQHKDEIRMLALGDSGCSIVTGPPPGVKDAKATPCSPDMWPLHEVSQAAQTEDPDFIVHVGDYRYWNEPGTTYPPSGDTWEAWKGDFFRPAQPLLTKAPWAFSRGNHENCNSGWYGNGYYYFLGQDVGTQPFDCSSGNRRDENWKINIKGKKDSANNPIPGHDFIMIDTAPSSGILISELQNSFSDAIIASSGKSSWWVTHRPVVSLEYYNGGWQRDDLDTVKRFSETLSNSGKSIGDLCTGGKCFPSLMVFGHEHFYQYIDFSNPSPDMAITGNSGTYSHDDTGLVQSPCIYDDFLEAFENLSAEVAWSNAHGYTIWSRTHKSAASETGWDRRPVFVNGSKMPAGPAKPCAH